MLTYESSASIDASVEAVWRVLSDVSQWPKWLPTVSRVEPLNGVSLRLGSRFAVHQPRLRPATWTVSEIDEPRRFVWVARSPGIEMVAEHGVTQDSPATSRVVLRYSFGGLLGGLVGRIFRSVSESYLAQEATSLKQRVETLAAETEALREAYAALNRNDVPAAVKAFDPQIEWTEPPEYPTGGTYRGHAEVQAHLSKTRGTWAEGSCEPERFIVAGDKIIVFLRVHVRLQHSTEWIDGEIADVYTFRDGRAIQMRHFPDRRQALEWAGVEASEKD